MQRLLIAVLLAVFCSAFTFGQAQVPASVQESLVPRLVNFNGVATDLNGKPLSGIVGITFSIYKDQDGGAPMWIETQSLTLRAAGRYTVTLGATKSDGIPVELFASGEARWVGVQVEGQAEQPRVLLVSVPYAMKAGDAATVGGLPPSAFMLAPTGSASGGQATAPGSAKSNLVKPKVHPDFTSSGSANYIPMFSDSSGDLGNSGIFQSSSGNIGIGYTSPNARLVIAAPSGGSVLNATNLADQDMQITVSAPGATDKHTYFGSSTPTNLTLGVGGTEMMRITNSGNVGIGYSYPTNARVVIGAPKGGGVLNSSNLVDQDMFVTLSAPGASDKKAYFGPGTPTNLTLGVGGTEMMRITNAGNVGIGTPAPAATLEVNGTTKFDGLVSFASGQTFPGLASLGTNTFTGNQTVNGNVSATGLVTGSGYQIGSNLFAFGAYSYQNAFLGFAGNMAMTGYGNTGTGYRALLANSTGYLNTASGYLALTSITAGGYNTANGAFALYNHTSGAGGNTATGAYALYSSTTSANNTATGINALFANTTGYANTASGNGALSRNTTGNYNNASGSGALGFNTTASYNNADGYQALYLNTTGASNSASGYQALLNNTTGNLSTANGYQALYSNTTSGGNTANGAEALYHNNTGPINTAVGYVALYENTTGGYNTSEGAYALYSNTTGSTNTAVGYQALFANTTGSGLTCVGAYCAVTAAGLTNATAIGAYATVSQSNSLVLGGTGEHAVKIGIGTTTPSSVLTIGRGLGHPVSDSWETYSSRRWKTNIHTLHGALGKVEQLRGVSYDLKDSGKHELGVIAEEVGAVVPEVVTWEKNGTDAQGVDYGRLTALLIEATKEQQALIRQQQQEITRLRSQVRSIQAALKKSGRPGSEVRRVKAQVSPVHQ